MKQYKNYWTTNNHLSKSLLTNTAVVNPELLKDFSDAEKWLDGKEAAGFRVGLIGVMGSRAFGNPRPDSDYDLRGFYVISPRNWMGSLHQSAPQTLTFKQGNVDIELQELSTFTRLLRRGNQNNMLLISSLCNNSVSFGSVCRLNKRIFPTKGAITNFFTLACKVKPLNKKIQGKDLLSLEGQLKSDLIDILRRERTDEQAKKTCKNIVKLLYVLNISKTQGFNKSLNGTNVKIFHESWFALIPFKALNPKSLEVESEQIQKAVKNFDQWATSVGLTTWVLAPIHQYDVCAHALSGGMGVPYAGVDVRTHMQTIQMNMPLYVEMIGRTDVLDVRVTGLETRMNRQEKITKQHSEKLEEHNRRLESVERISKAQSEALASLKNELEAESRARLIAQQQAEQRAQELRSARWQNEDPLIIAINGTNISGEGKAIMGPCWGPDIDQIVIEARKLEVITEARRPGSSALWAAIA